MSPSSPKKAIVLAAGRGRRLMPYTQKLPKCLVPVDHRSILNLQCDAFRANGIAELVVIRGYLGETLAAKQSELSLPVRFVDNAEWAENNILESLFCARRELVAQTQSVLISYSDILFTPRVVAKLCAAPAPIALAIDRDFRLLYEGRTDHPLSEAEVARCENDQVLTVGKRSLPAEQASGEFIGLCKLSPSGAATFVRRWDELQAEYSGRREQPYQRAASFRQAYLTDLFQDLIHSGHRLAAVEIAGHWREIDTAQDLERARALLRSNRKEWTEDRIEWTNT